MSQFKAKVVGGTKSADRAEVRRALGVLIDPGQTFELRGLSRPRAVRSIVCRGDDLDRATEAAWDLSDMDGVYWTLNPCRPTLEKSARVGDILARRWLLIDVDAVRPVNTPSTHEELIAASDLAIDVWEYLSGLGWPEPVAIDSGNGAHLLYRIDLPADKPAQDLVKGVLLHLAERFDSDVARVDRSVHNASRISKLPGTWARKGQPTAERPHRMARMVSVPSTLEVVSADQLKTLGRKEVEPEVNGHTKSPFVGVASNGTLAGYVRSAIERECGRILLTPPGGRNVALNRSAFSLGTMAGWPEMTEPMVRGALLDVALRAGLDEAETRKTIESGWTAGAASPRVRPLEPSRNGVAPKPTGLSIILASQVIPRKVEWLWPDRIPIGKLTTFAGWGGLGKSFVTMDLAARISRGNEIPGLDGECFEQGNVLILNTEDDPDDTSVPRLIDAEADLARIAFAKSEVLCQFTLADLKTLDLMLDQLGGARLLVIDPATAHLGMANDHRNSELRALLMPLSLWAMERHIAVILVTHVNKPQAGKVEAMARVVGSVAWVNAVRAAVMFAKDPDDKTRRLYIPFKSNNAPEKRGLAYRLVNTPREPDGKPLMTARIDWMEEVDTSADEAMNHQVVRKSVPQDTLEWLEDKFRERRQWPSKDLERMALAAGISTNAIFKSRPGTRLNAVIATIDKRRSGTDWAWFAPPGWPPEKQSESCETCESWNVTPLETTTSELSQQLSPRLSHADQGPLPTPDESSDESSCESSEDVITKGVPSQLSHVSHVSPMDTGGKGSSSPIELDADLESPAKRLERRRFKVGTWLRNFLFGSTAPGVYVLRKARECGFEEGEIREIARIIGVDMTGEDWVYRGF